MTFLASLPDSVREAVLRMVAGADLVEVLRAIETSCERWGLELGYPMAEWGHALSIRCRRHRNPVVLKVSAQTDMLSREVAVYRASGGRGYPLVLEAAPGAVLFEAVGAPVDLAALENKHGAYAVIDLLSGLLTQVWSTPVPTVVDKIHPALALLHEIEQFDAADDSPYGPAIGRAMMYARQRLDADDPSRHVLVHGNLIEGVVRHRFSERPDADTGYLLIAPRGFRCDREYDLGGVLRDRNLPLLNSEDAVVSMRAWCAHLAKATDADAELIWQWAFLHRVAEGVRRMRGTNPLSGRPYLQASMALVSRPRG